MHLYTQKERTNKNNQKINSTLSYLKTSFMGTNNYYRITHTLNCLQASKGKHAQHKPLLCNAEVYYKVDVVVFSIFQAMPNSTASTELEWLNDEPSSTEKKLQRYYRLSFITRNQSWVIAQTYMYVYRHWLPTVFDAKINVSFWGFWLL